MGVFMQHKRDDWDEVIGRGANALRECIATGAVAAHPPSSSTSSLRAHNSRVGTADVADTQRRFFTVAQTRFGLMQFRADDMPVGRSLDWYGEYLQLQLDL